MVRAQGANWMPAADAAQRPQFRAASRPPARLQSAAAAPTIGAATIGVARDVAVPAAPLDESTPISLLSGPIKERKIYAEMQDLYAVMVGE